jgi:hypothetical protein
MAVIEAEKKFSGWFPTSCSDGQSMKFDEFEAKPQVICSNSCGLRITKQRCCRRTSQPTGLLDPV